MSVAESPKHGLQKPKTISQEKKIAEDEFMAAAIGDVEWLRQSLRGQRGVVNFDRNGLAPIHLAAIHGRVECLRLLVEKFKVDVNTPSTTGWRPVHLCISNQTGKRAYQSLQYLLDKGADPSVANDDGITPMHQAASEGHVQCLKALIDAGGKVWEKDDRGHTPIDLAKLWGHRKCARLLATENWHQSKMFLAKEMGQLQKLKMQQDIEKNEHTKQDQAFFGEQAYNDWMKNSGLTNPDTWKMESNVKPPPKLTPRKEKAQSTESTYKPNSKRRPPGAPSPIKEESSTPNMTARRETFNSPNDGYGSSMSQREDQEKEQDSKTMEASEQREESTPLWYNPNEWVKSTKVPGKPYEPILPDHYPRDEYTMQHKYPARRHDFSKSNIYAGSQPEEKPAKVRMPQLPADVIDRKLHPENYERPVVFKCKHIEDVHKKERYPTEVLPRQEIGIHLMDDMSSLLFKRGLQPNKLSADRLVVNGSSPNFAEFMMRMSRPTNYPRINGEEFKISRTAAM